EPPIACGGWHQTCRVRERFALKDQRPGRQRLFAEDAPADCARSREQRFRLRLQAPRHTLALHGLQQTGPDKTADMHAPVRAKQHAGARLEEFWDTENRSAQPPPAPVIICQAEVVPMGRGARRWWPS